MSGNNPVNDPQQGFMQRWSRRKLEVQQEEPAKTVDEPILETKSEQVAVAVEEPPKTDADMPPIESLTEESDFSGFMSPQVSEALRKQALRKLFHMPSMNVVDELDDYAEDFTSFVPLGDLIPHDMKRMLEREKAKLEEKLQAEASAEQVTEQQASNEQQVQEPDNDVASVESAEVTDVELVPDNIENEEV